MAPSLRLLSHTGHRAERDLECSDPGLQETVRNLISHWGFFSALFLCSQRTVRLFHLFMYWVLNLALFFWSTEGFHNVFWLSSFLWKLCQLHISLFTHLSVFWRKSQELFWVIGIVHSDAFVLLLCDRHSCPWIWKYIAIKCLLALGLQQCERHYKARQVRQRIKVPEHSMKDDTCSGNDSKIYFV